MTTEEGLFLTAKRVRNGR